MFPASALLAAAAPEVFHIVLGPRWAGAATLTQILVPFYALSAVAAQCGAVLLARGRNAPLFWALTGLSAGRVLAFLLGPWGGPVGIACGIDLATLLYAAAMFTAVGALNGGGARPLVRELIPPLAAAALGGTVCHSLIALEPESIGWTAACLAAGGCTFLLGMMALQGRRLMADAFAIRRVVLARR